jgi:hypothetical protein
MYKLVEDYRGEHGRLLVVDDVTETEDMRTSGETGEKKCM